MKEYIAFIATAWGPEHGGINAYNYDLCINLQKTLNSNLGIICIIFNDITQDEILKNKNIEFICLKKEKNDSEINSADIENISIQLKAKGYNINWFIGHDITTGHAALNCSRCFSESFACVIHHMDYESYESYKVGNTTDSKHKIDNQRELLKNSDLVLSVGPKLLQSAKNKIRGGKCKHVDLIIPGLADIHGLEIEDPFSIIISGRIEEKIEPIKQIGLAVNGFAKTFNDSHNNLILNNDPKITLVGFSNNTGDKKRIKKIKKDAYKIAERKFTINTIPYLNDRTQLFNELNRHQLSMMLSLHEGFGLVGWEAIAAEVPLILTKNSGLYEFLNNLGTNAVGNVLDIDIRGSIDNDNYNEKDIKTVSDKILSFRLDKERFKKNAIELKKFLLEKGFTWEKMAHQFLTKLEYTKKSINENNRGNNGNILIISDNVKDIVPSKRELSMSNPETYPESFDKISRYFEPFSKKILFETLDQSTDISAFLSASLGDHPNSQNPHKRYHLGHYYFVKIIDELLELYNTTDKIHICLFPSMTYFKNDPNYRKMLSEIQAIWSSCFFGKINSTRIDQLVRSKSLADHTNIVEWLRLQREKFLNLSDKEIKQLDLFRSQKLNAFDENKIADICRAIINDNFYATNIEILSFACLMYKPSKWFSENWFVSALLSLLEIETSNENIQNKILGTNKITIIESSKNMKAWEAMSCCCQRFDIKGFPSRAYFKTLTDLSGNPMSSSNYEDAIFLHESRRSLKKRVTDVQIKNTLRQFQLETESDIMYSLDSLIGDGRKRLSQNNKENGRKRIIKRNK